MRLPNTTASLFDAYPVTDRYELSSGTLCQVPFYCHSANMVILHGLVELDAVGRLLEGQNYLPVGLNNGKGIASLWVVQYEDTSCGPYHEIILTFVTSRKRLQLGYDTPMDLLGAAFHADAMTFCYKLYLNQQVPIEYGRELHGIPKDRTPQPIDISLTESRFRFTLGSEGRQAVRGDLQLPQEPAPTVRVSFPFVTPVELLQTRNVLHYEFAPRLRVADGADTLTFLPDTEFGRQLRELNFQLGVVQYAPGARFVMPKPLNWLQAG